MLCYHLHNNSLNELSIIIPIQHIKVRLRGAEQMVTLATSSVVEISVAGDDFLSGGDPSRAYLQ
jgi:hypothetical protein